MGIPQDQSAKYTYGDYLTWDDEQRWEIIEGTAYAMAPAPTIKHQDIGGNIFTLLKLFLKNKPCKAYIAPVDVLLPAENQVETEIKTVVQPDVFVVCDKNKEIKTGIVGAPDLVIEILSPSTASKDQIKKRALYEKHGVKEYWVIHPTDEIVSIYTLQNDGFYGKPANFDKNGAAHVGILPGLTIDMGEVFAE